MLLPIALLSSPKLTQAAAIESPAAKAKRMKWFTDARFGMFIHWGLYSQAAGEWQGKPTGGAGEWILNDMQIPPADYEALKPQFNPYKFNADRWVQIAKNAGMKYIVITSKHHEGFAMYPSKLNDWNIGTTQFKRDPLKELSVACKKAGIRLCFYHSIMDWHNPDYLPHRTWDKREGMRSDLDQYVTFMKGQLKELLTNYGPIGLIWFDGQWEGTWNHERGKDLEAYVRSLQPNIIINNRVDSGNGRGTEPEAGDYGTPEQFIPANGLPGQFWESCMTMNGTWGFNQHDTNWKSSETLIQNVIDCASKGGNYLLNVGPTGLGEIPDASVERLAAVGKWMKANGDAVYGTQAGPFSRPQPWGRVTKKGNRLFLHVFEKGARTINLAGLKTTVSRIYPLNEPNESLTYQISEDGVKVNLPASTSLVPVYVLEYRGQVSASAPVISQAANGTVDLTARDAESTGGIQFESDNNALGFWTNIGDTAAWSFEVKKWSPLRISVELACEKGSEGSTFSIEVGGQSVTGKVPSTDSWKKFTTIDLGAVTLKSGRAHLVVKAISKPGNAVMNLRRVSLKP